MAATLSTMAMLNAKCMTSGKAFKAIPTKPISLLSIQNLSKGLTVSKSSPETTTISLTGTAFAGAIFSTLSSCDAALAAQQIADIAEGDNRGIALLLPLVPAIAWVLFNILQPALNQINRMRTEKGVIVGLGIGGSLAASSGLFATPEAAAGEMATIAEAAAAAAANDNRGQLLLFVIAPAILWVLYNILQPALNQINKMRSE